MGVIVFITPSIPFWEAFFTARSKFAHRTQAILQNSTAFYADSRHRDAINLLIARMLSQVAARVITLGKANFHRKNFHRLIEKLPRGEDRLSNSHLEGKSP